MSTKKYTIEELSKLLNITDCEIYEFMNSGQLCFTRNRGFEVTFSKRCVKNFIPIIEKYRCHKGKNETVHSLIFEKPIEIPAKNVINLSEPEKIKALINNEPKLPAIQPKPEVKPIDLKSTPPIEKAIRNKELVIDESKVKACQGEHVGEYVPATWSIGVKNQWHLCDDCAKLPKFKKFKKRIRIEI